MFKVSYCLFAKPKALHKSNTGQKGADGSSQESLQLTFLSQAQYPSMFCRDYNLQACDGNRTWEANWATLANKTSREVQGTLRSNLASENRLSNMLGFKGTTEAHYTRALQTCHFTPSQIKAKSREQWRTAGKTHLSHTDMERNDMNFEKLFKLICLL